MKEEKQPSKENSQPVKEKAAAGAEKQSAQAPAAKKAVARKKSWKSVTFARIYITCSFNNTIITATDDKGDTIAWATSGLSGFRGTKKGTPFAAQITAGRVAHKAAEMGVKQVNIFVSGPGPGRETAIRAVQSAGLHIIAIKDVTPLPHNGCRPPKARRV